MPLVSFLVLTAVGASIWTTILTLAGFYLGKNYEVIATMLAPYSKLFLLLAVAIIIAWLIKRRLSAQHNSTNI